MKRSTTLAILGPAAAAALLAIGGAILMLRFPSLRPGHRFPSRVIRRIPLESGELCVLKTHGYTSRAPSERFVSYEFLTDAGSESSAILELSAAAQLLTRELDSECTLSATITIVRDCPKDCEQFTRSFLRRSLRDPWIAMTSGATLGFANASNYSELRSCRAGAPNPSLQRTRFARR